MDSRLVVRQDGGQSLIESEFREQLRREGLLRHQVDFAANLSESQPPVRVLLTSPPGMGKSVAIASALRRLSRKIEGSFRSFVVTPPALKSNWQALLQRFGGIDAVVVDPRVYRHLQAETDRESNPWEARNSYIASQGWLREGPRMVELLKAEWDVFVIDEAHHYSPRSMRGRILNSIWEGEIPYVVASSTSIERPIWLATSSRTQTVEWRRAELRDWDGDLLLPQSTLDFVPYELSSPERAFLEQLMEASKGLRNTKSLRPMVRVMLRRAASSLFAIEQFLLRQLSTSVRDKDPSFDLPDELSAALHDLLLKSPTRSTIPRETLDGMLALLERIERDSKWMACEELLKSLKGKSAEPVIIFTDFAETARYLGDLLDEGGWKASIVTSSMSLEDRWKRINEASQRSEVLVVTSAVTEGASLAFADTAIHYDLPWDPTSLLKRKSRVESVENPAPKVYHHVLIDDVILKRGFFTRLRNQVARLEGMSAGSSIAKS